MVICGEKFVFPGCHIFYFMLAIFNYQNCRVQANLGVLHVLFLLLRQ
jgi:hypothetical protein